MKWSFFRSNFEYTYIPIPLHEDNLRLLGFFAPSINPEKRPECIERERGRQGGPCAISRAIYPCPLCKIPRDKSHEVPRYVPHAQRWEKRRRIAGRQPICECIRACREYVRACVHAWHGGEPYAPRVQIRIEMAAITVAARWHERDGHIHHPRSFEYRGAERRMRRDDKRKTGGGEGEGKRS